MTEPAACGHLPRGVPGPSAHDSLDSAASPGGTTAAPHGPERGTDSTAPPRAAAEAGAAEQFHFREIDQLDPGAPEIRVLGRVEIAGRDVHDLEAGKRNLLPELAAFLYLNPGCGAEEVSRALGGPRGAWSQSTRASNMSRLRTWFGRDREGRLHVPTRGQGRLYTLSGVCCDWERFQRLAKRGSARLAGADRDRGIGDLQGALSLVRGKPFAGSGPSSYVWAEHLKQLMISSIVEVAHALAVQLTQAGNASAARTAIARALDIEPGSELLFRDLLRAERRAGNVAGMEEATERLLFILHELGLEMEPETAQVIERLRPPRRDVGALPRSWNC
ncbi:hypothetical protein GCM10010191_11200 [Actinomadura vinacea]|uniref:Bacterial transcriptional activator domain-containing protein n=1 Tax=Actinomadura vinacea TaxID=115336 RepID=A0ABN3IHU4_9ACTN